MPRLCVRSNILSAKTLWAVVKPTSARYYYDRSYVPAVCYRVCQPYAPGQLERAKPKTAYIDFKLAGRTFCAMDHAMAEGDAFNEAVSLIVCCDDQREIDEYWEKLSIAELKRAYWGEGMDGRRQ